MNYKTMPQNGRDPNNDSSSFDSQRTALAVILMLFLVAVAGFFWAYSNYKESQEKIKNLQTSQQQQLGQQQQQKAIEKVANHMVLPEGQPGVVTITNPKELAKQQDFFKQAEKNDILLLYRDKAILYRSSTDKIVDVQPVTTRNNTSTATQQSQTITVDVRNGGASTSSFDAFTNRLRQAEAYSVSSVGNAATTSYNQNLLINNSGEDISFVEQELGLSALPSLPEGETTSTADAVIILVQ